MKQQLWNFQLWYNEGNETLYETRLCNGRMIMYAPSGSGFYITQNNVNSSFNNWVYIGDSI